MNFDKFFEKLGIKYFNHLYQKSKAPDYIQIDGLPSDKLLHIVVKNILYNSIIIAFLIGALTSVPLVIIEIVYKNSLDFYHYHLYYFTAVFFMIVIELGVLYWVSFQAIYTLANLLGYKDIKEDITLPSEYQLNYLLVRSALELPDPVLEYLGTNPLKYISQKKLILFSILYKAKVVLTSAILRILLKKISIRFGLRLSFAWIIIPVTAFWDGYTMYKVIKDAKLRLFGYQLSLYIVNEILTEEFLQKFSFKLRITAIRAVATVMTMSEHYHPNNILLLIKLSHNFDIKDERDYDDWDEFLKDFSTLSKKEKDFILSLLVISASFDGKLSKKEKIFLPKVFENRSEDFFNMTQDIIRLLSEARLHEVARKTKNMLKID